MKFDHDERDGLANLEIGSYRFCVYKKGNDNDTFVHLGRSFTRDWDLELDLFFWW